VEIYAFFKIFFNRRQLKKYGLRVYWGTVLAITGLIINCYYINGNIYYNLSVALLLLFTCYLLLLSVIVSIRSAEISRELALSSAQLAAAKEQIAIQAGYYDALSAQINEIRAIRHDFRHFVSVLARLSEEERYPELEQFLNEYSVKSDTEPLPVYCENAVVNSILGYYSFRFKELNFPFHCTCVIPRQLTVSDSDLCIVLGNALENAWEACQQLEASQKRWVSVEARLLQGQFLIKVANSFNGTVKMSNGRYLSTKKKPDHGIGLQNIHKVVAAYGGYVKLEHTRTVFTFMAAFPAAVADL